MMIKIRNYALAVLVLGACLIGLAGPIMYPEYMVEAQMNSGYYIPMI
jgi:hypothetical protein